MLASLNCFDKPANCFAPSVVVPNNNANASEFLPIISTKSVIGIPAFADASRNCIRFCPNVAPTDDNVLNASVDSPNKFPILASDSPTRPNSARDAV